MSDWRMLSTEHTKYLKKIFILALLASVCLLNYRRPRSQLTISTRLRSLEKVKLGII